MDLYIDTNQSHRYFVIYRPTNSSSVYSNSDDVYSYISNITSCIRSHLNNKGPTIVIGDVNLPDINWQSLSSSTGLGQIFCDLCVQNSFTQCIFEATRGNNVLDIVLTNDDSCIVSSTVCPPFSTSDLNSVEFITQYCSTCTGPSANNLNNKLKYKWHLANYDAMNELLTNVDWHGVVATKL